MPAPKKNSYWLNRKTHGRKPEFQTPEEFEQAWIEYFDWVDKHPWYKNEAIKSGVKVGKIIKVPTKRPYTEIGFCVYHTLGRNYINQLEKKLTEQPNDDFSGVLSWARGVCTADKFEGAAVGVYNPGIISRDLELVDKHDVRHNGIPQNQLPQINVYNSGPPLASTESEIET